MDLIERQAAIDTLDDGAEYLRRVLDVTELVGVEREKYAWGLDLLEACIADVKELPTVQPEPQWIPVERELPEPRIDVWVNSDLGQMTGYYDETVELWYGRDYLELIVNAWMPLPAPYKKGAKE